MVQEYQSPHAKQGYTGGSSASWYMEIYKLIFTNWDLQTLMAWVSSIKEKRHAIQPITTVKNTRYWQFQAVHIIHIYFKVRLDGTLGNLFQLKMFLLIVGTLKVFKGPFHPKIPFILHALICGFLNIYSTY